MSPILPPPKSPTKTNPSPSSSRYSKRGPAKLKRQIQKSRVSRQSTTPTPSIASTTSSLSEVKHIFSSWIGNIRAGVSGAWTKAKGETETYLASQEGETRMQRRRNEILSLNEPTVKGATGIATDEKTADSELGAGKRPATSDGSTLPAMKKRSLNAKKLKKQKSLGKLPFGKSSISYPMPNNTLPTSPGRPPPAPVYRATTGFIENESDDGLRTKVESLETELSSLRAKLRWFEQSYGEIPAESLVDIKPEPTKKTRRSVFKEELGSLRSRNMSETSIGDHSILPRDIKELKGFERDGIDVIAEESDETNRSEKVIPPESTIKLIPPSPSVKSIASPPRPPRSPTKTQMSPLSSPTKSHISPLSSPTKLDISPLSSPTKSRLISSPVENLDKSVDLLETLSPIHPNIIPALIPRQSRPDLLQENINSKLNDIAD